MQKERGGVERKKPMRVALKSAINLVFLLPRPRPRTTITFLPTLLLPPLLRKTTTPSFHSSLSTPMSTHQLQVQVQVQVQVRDNIELSDIEKRIFDRLLATLRHFNLQTQLRVAGGWVRDKLLGEECYDIDIALDNMMGTEFVDKAREYLLSIGEDAQGVCVIQSNPDQSKHLETARMRLFDMWIDFVNLRSEEYTDNSRIPSKQRFGTAEEDAYRRDLTINSLFYNINTDSVEDFTKRGISDLKSGKIVTPLPPKATFLDDPLRVVRAIRFGARFEFTLDEDLKQAAACDEVKDALAAKISRERIGTEIDLMISGNQPVKAMTYICDMTIFWIVFSLPPMFEPAISDGCERLCISYLDIAWKLIHLLGKTTFTDEQRRLTLYAALFLPLRNTIYKEKKAKKVLPDPQPWTAPKKSWHQLFTRSSSVPQSSNSNVICRPNSKIQTEAKSPQLSCQSPVTKSFDNPIHFGLPSPFNISTYPNGSASGSLGFSPPIEPFFSPVGNRLGDFRHEEQELFEDPCYVPDPVSLLGPVSESLDNFQLDLGTGNLKDMEVAKPHSLKNISAGSDVNRPSPIESPLSREKRSCSNWLPSTLKAQDMHAFPLDDAAANDKGTWQMWSTSPLGQEGLGLIGSPESWVLPLQRTVTNKDEFVLPSSQKTMSSLFNKDDNILSSTHSPHNFFLPNGQCGATFSPVIGSSAYDPWSQSTIFPPLSGSLKAQESVTQNEMIYGPSGSASSHVLEGSPSNSWSKKEWAIHGSMENVGNSSVARPHHNGCLHPPASDVQSFWSSFDQKNG